MITHWKVDLAAPVVANQTSLYYELSSGPPEEQLLPLCTPCKGKGAISGVYSPGPQTVGPEERGWDEVKGNPVQVFRAPNILSGRFSTGKNGIFLFDSSFLL